MPADNVLNNSKGLIMTSLEYLERSVRELYEGRNPNRAEWADWLYGHHVFVVADKAGVLAQEVGADRDLARAAGMLHDIADAVMSRFDDRHEVESGRVARELMERAGFGSGDIELVVEDGLRWHGCHDGRAPESKEGQVLATADAWAHLTTDFYIYAVHAMARSQTLAEAKAWVLKKARRDFCDKVRFESVREQVRPDYEAVLRLFSR